MYGNRSIVRDHSAPPIAIFDSRVSLEGEKGYDAEAAVKRKFTDGQHFEAKLHEHVWLKDYLETKDGQRIFYMEWGKRGGTPFVFFHGGPGDSFYLSHIKLFNPDTDHVLFFDQRGCGESRPKASTLSEEDIVKTGRPEQIVDDTEKLIGIVFGSSKVNLVGGSWGTTISLLYAEAHPERTKSMVFWATYLAGHAETDAMFSDRSKDETFPYQAQWKEFIDHVPNTDVDKYTNGKIDPHKVANFFAKMVSLPDKEIALFYAKAFYRWELTLCSPEDFEKVWKHLTEDPDQTIAGARIELLYHKHHTMLTDGEILNNVKKINHIPCFIVQGDRDYCTPTEYAIQLKRAYGDKCIVEEVHGGHIRDDEQVNAAIRRNLNHVREAHLKKK